MSKEKSQVMWFREDSLINKLNEQLKLSHITKSVRYADYKNSLENTKKINNCHTDSSALTNADSYTDSSAMTSAIVSTIRLW